MNRSTGVDDPFGEQTASTSLALSHEDSERLRRRGFDVCGSDLGVLTILSLRPRGLLLSLLIRLHLPAFVHDVTLLLAVQAANVGLLPFLVLRKRFPLTGLCDESDLRRIAS